MANGKQAAAKRAKMEERARQQLALHFPGIHQDWLWHRKRNDGFITIPRTMPIFMEAIDTLTKGQPAGQTLLTLWCRSPDHALVTIDNPAIFASETGFSGERMVDTWRRRMKKLTELGFIVPKPGAAGDMHYVLLLNPNWAMERLRPQIPASIYAKFVDRMMDIGALGELEAIRANIVRWAEEAAAAAAAAVQAELLIPPSAEETGTPTAIEVAPQHLTPDSVEPGENAAA